MSELIEILGKFPDLIKEIYGDLAKPGVSQAGKAIGGIIGLGNTILLPVHIANGRSDIYIKRNLERYREQVEKIDIKDTVEVLPEIGVPILEKLTYISNEELSQMYINILAKASSKNTQNQAHPSFVNIINSLSQDEAKLIKHLNGKNDIPFIDRILENNNSTYNVLSSSLTGIEKDVDLLFSDNMPAYLSNLEGLGIINSRRDSWASDEELYKKLDEKYLFKIAGNVQDLKISYKKGIIKVTDFGRLFIKSCSLLIKT